MDTQKKQFQLNLPGLLKVLAENLYSSRKVAIRELVQNAHDSIVRRQLDEKDSRFQPRITVRTDSSKGIITIQDNGSGMTDDDIVTYLTTIGNSYTREVGTSLEFSNPDEASNLIGQFGLGFLSAFLIASEVTLYTRAKNSTQGWRWHCDASEFYEMAPVDFEQTGTFIELKVKPEAEFLLTDTELAEVIRRYADFLAVPIYLNNDPAPVNLMTPPWEEKDPTPAIVNYIDRVFRNQSPIHVFQLRDETVDLGHDTLVVPLKGFMFIPSNTVLSVHEYGDLIVYIRRMYITDQERDLLPSWAKFFRGLIECSVLQPTASRESLHQEDTFIAVQQALESQLLQELRRIAREEPAIWRQIIVSHTDLVLGWMAVNNEFFDQVADLLPIQTSRGMMTLPEYLKRTDNSLYYVTQQIGSLQDQLLGEGFEVPVIDASWFAVKPFLDKYASRQPSRTRLVQMDGDAKRLMRPVTDSRYDGLVAFFEQQKINAKMVAYKPHSVPALMLYPHNANTLLEARRALDANELSLPFAAMVSEYLSRQDDDAESQPSGVLYLNASCDLINQLTTFKSLKQRNAVLTLIYQVARLFAGRTLTAQDASQAFSAVSTSIQEIVTRG